MPQSLSRVWLHVTFSTKERRAYLQREDFRDEMLSILFHQIERAGCVPLQTGGWIDHVHLVCGLSRTVAIATLLEHVKVETSKWAKSATHGSPTFSWQSGYGAFSVSQSNLDQVVDYVRRQPAHHAKQSFQEEFRELCRRHELELDERYAWD
ncbi:MAG: transposase [Schlesneria sp.]|nr:transposase [Schlesneria sp.]